MVTYTNILCQDFSTFGDFNFFNSDYLILLAELTILSYHLSSYNFLCLGQKSLFNFLTDPV